MKLRFFHRGFAVAALVVLCLFAARPASAQSGSSGSVQQEIINGVIQNVIQSVRDELQRRRVVPPAAPMRFSGEGSQFDGKDPFAQNGASDPFSALAYTKAPPLAPASSAWLYGANLVGSGDRATTLGTETHVENVTGAFDVTKIGIFTATDALTFIGTGSHTWSHAVTPSPFVTMIVDGSIPSTSGTLSYLNGGFSADLTVLASWTSSSVNSGFVVADASSVATTANAQYRFDFPYSVWFEPTGGLTYTEFDSANFGTKLGDNTEVHGGMRVGTEMKWMGYTVQPTFSGVAFRVVDSNATPVAVGVAPIGATGFRGSAKVTVLWTPNFSSYLEAHGTETTTPIGILIPSTGTQTYGAQAGLRYTWN